LASNEFSLQDFKASALNQKAPRYVIYIMYKGTKCHHNPKNEEDEEARGVGGRNLNTQQRERSQD